MALFEGDPLILVPPNFVKFYLSLILKILLEKFEFWRACLEGPSHRGTFDFRWAPVHLEIFDSSQCDSCAVCGLKVDSDSEKKRKKKKIKKNFIQGRINEYDHDKGGSSMFKKHKLFFINIRSYQDIPD